MKIKIFKKIVTDSYRSSSFVRAPKLLGIGPSSIAPSSLISMKKVQKHIIGIITNIIQIWYNISCIQDIEICEIVEKFRKLSSKKIVRSPPKLNGKKLLFTLNTCTKFSNLSILKMVLDIAKYLFR